MFTEKMPKEYTIVTPRTNDTDIFNSLQWLDDLFLRVGNMQLEDDKEFNQNHPNAMDGIIKLIDKTKHDRQQFTWHLCNHPIHLYLAFFGRFSTNSERKWTFCIPFNMFKMKRRTWDDFKKHFNDKLNVIIFKIIFYACCLNKPLPLDITGISKLINDDTKLPHIDVLKLFVRKHFKHMNEYNWLCVTHYLMALGDYVPTSEAETHYDSDPDEIPFQRQSDDDDEGILPSKVHNSDSSDNNDDDEDDDDEDNLEDSQSLSTKRKLSTTTPPGK